MAPSSEPRPPTLMSKTWSSSSSRHSQSWTGVPEVKLCSFTSRHRAGCAAQRTLDRLLSQLNCCRTDAAAQSRSSSSTPFSGSSPATSRHRPATFTAQPGTSSCSATVRGAGVDDSDGSSGAAASSPCAAASSPAASGCSSVGGSAGGSVGGSVGASVGAPAAGSAPPPPHTRSSGQWASASATFFRHWPQISSAGPCGHQQQNCSSSSAAASSSCSLRPPLPSGCRPCTRYAQCILAAFSFALCAGPPLKVTQEGISRSRPLDAA
mmetsp:Transcript_24554/g.68656  ORF Transcript_24554/g.68656 Transcript_24554/m.68656 type:complete len:266 (-) Transcript_24554:948-1745(-)